MVLDGRRDYDGEIEKGKKGEVNLLKQPMTRGMQNQVLFFHVFQPLRAVVQMKRRMKMTAPAMEGTYFQR